MKFARWGAIALAALSVPAMSQAVRAEGDAEAGMVKANTCMGCHGIPYYNNVYPTYRVPMIGGQSAAYIQAALKASRSGERPHGTMHAQASSMSDQDIADIAAYLATAPRHEVATVAGGEAAVPEKAAVCATCHGQAGAKPIAPDYPILAGQYADYLAHALHEYHDGQRKNPLMTPQAAQLSDADIKALARYFAAQDSPLYTPMIPAHKVK